MQAASSAKRTCSESRSTSLWTATVLMPISLHVQMMRHAISPRFAIRIFLNLRGLKAIHKKAQMNCIICAPVPLIGLVTNAEKRLPIFDGLSILNVNLYYFTRRLSLNLVHELHRFDNAHH